MVGTPRRGWLIAALVVAVSGLLGSGVVAAAWAESVAGSRSAAPDLPGSLVRVTLTNMGGPMMGGRATKHPGLMRASAEPATVPAGVVSFLVTNRGGIDHELVVLPLTDNQNPGTRPTGTDAKTDETGSLGEASTTHGQGPGHGIRPGTQSWVSVTLTPGRYELLCNLPGHYTAGMFTTLTVS